MSPRIGAGARFRNAIVAFKGQPRKGPLLTMAPAAVAGGGAMGRREAAGTSSLPSPSGLPLSLVLPYAPLKGHSAAHSLARCGGCGQGWRISLCPRQPSKSSRAGLTFK